MPATEPPKAKEVLKRPEPTGPFNPFVSNTPELSTWEWVKVCVLGITLAPIRAIIIAASIALLGLWCTICLIGIPPKSKTPIPQWRLNLTLPVVQLGARFLLFVLGFYYIDVKGKKADSKDAPILVANHISYFEPIFFTSQGCSHVAKAGVRTIPCAGPIFRVLQTVFVERTSKASCTETKDDITGRAKAPGSWPTLAIYPEGTIGSGKSLLRFRHGAFAAGSAVQPAIVRYRYTFFDPAQPTGCRLYNLRVLCQFVQFMEVEYLPVYEPNVIERTDAKAYAENVRLEIAEALNAPTTDFEVGDILLGMVAQAANLPANVGYIEWGKFQKFLGWSLTDTQEELEEFAAIDRQKDGEITFDEFEAYTIGLGFTKGDPLVAEMFRMFDQDEDGSVSFREYLSAKDWLKKTVGAGAINEAVRMIPEEKRSNIDLSTFTHMVKASALVKISDESISELYGKLASSSPSGVPNEETLRAFLLRNSGLLTKLHKSLLKTMFSTRRS